MTNNNILFKKKDQDNDEKMLLQDIDQIFGGNPPSSFQAFIAENGSWSVPNNLFCFLQSDQWTSYREGRDTKLANA